MPLREAAALSWRGYVLWWKTAPEFFVCTAAKQVVNALAPYVPLYFTARLVNAVVGGGNGPQVWQMLGLLLVSTALAGLLRAVSANWADAVMESRIYPTRRRIFFEKLLSMDFQDVDNAKTQALLNQINQDETWSWWGMLNLLSNFNGMVKDLFTVLGAVALSAGLFAMPVPAGSPLAWLNHPGCLAAMLGLLAATMAVSAVLYNKSRAITYDGSFTNRLSSYFLCLGIQDLPRATDIRIYAQDKFVLQKNADLTLDFFGPNSPFAKASRGRRGLLRVGSEAAERVFSGAVYLFVGLKALGGAFGVGSVTQYVGALAGLSKGVADLIQSVVDLRENAEYLKPVFQFLDTPNKMYQGSLTTEKRADRNYEIEFKDVSFQYPGTDIWALRHVSMKFNVGERLAVVGENGSGKTTFIKLLCRLYDPTEGEILLNGIDIRKYRYDNYLALFSVVFQDFRLLAQPLGANVAAAEDYDRERAEQCLVKAGFGARLAELPKGLGTCLYREFEDDGVEISGGEAQKIALARVLYQDAPFIVLDEPTAALDPEAEAEIYTKFNDIVEDKTAIYISHRLSSCRFCDEIAVFDQGRVVQQGTHDGLVEAEGKYRSLWEAQAQYYKKED